MHEELPLAHFRMLSVAAVTVGADVHVHHPHLPALRPRIAVPEVHAPFTDGLDLRSEQRDARLVRLEDVIVMAGFAIVGDEPLRLLALVLVGHGSTTILDAQTTSWHGPASRR